MGGAADSRNSGRDAEGAHEVSACLGQLGNVAYLRGDYDAALNWYNKALASMEQLGNRAAMAAAYHQLGMLSENRGDYTRHSIGTRSR